MFFDIKHRDRFSAERAPKLLGSRYFVTAASILTLHIVAVVVVVVLVAVVVVVVVVVLLLLLLSNYYQYY